MTTPTWPEVTALAAKFRTEIGGCYGYVAAALEHDHRALKPENERNEPMSDMREKLARVLVSAQSQHYDFDKASERSPVKFYAYKRADAAIALFEAEGYVKPRKPSWWCENCGYPFPADEGNPTGKHDRCSICGSVDFTETRPATSPPETLDAVKAAAWDEAYQAGLDDAHDHALGLAAGRLNPYRKENPNE